MDTKVEYVDLDVCGIEIPHMKVMQAQWKGRCTRTGKWYDPAKGPTTIAFKHKDQLTEDQKQAIFGHKTAYHVTVVLTEADFQPKAPVSASKDSFTPSSYQNIILDNVLSNNKHVFIRALAGCGKTQTLVWIVKELAKRGLLRGKRVIYLAFNKAIQEELSRKLMGTGCPALTTHGFGYDMLRQIFRELAKAGPNCVFNGKNTEIFQRLLSGDLFGEYSDSAVKRAKKSEPYALRSVVCGNRGLVSFIKNWAIVPTWNGAHYEFSEQQKANIKDFITSYELLIPQKFSDEEAVNWACRVVTASIPLPGEALNRITYDDMLYLPTALSMKFPKYDLVLTDETQDFNYAQEQMLFSLQKEGARCIAVGDIFQCLYRFRGADSHAFEHIKETLESTDRDLVECVLPINYRSDEAIIKHAQRWVPELTGRGKELGQKEGEVIEDITFEEAIQEVNNDGKEDYSFLCRVNAPIVITAYQLISKGKKVAIIGRKAIGSPLVDIIDDLCASPPTKLVLDRRDNVGRVIEEGFLTRLRIWHKFQAAKLTEEEHTQNLEELNNNVECLEVIAQKVQGDSVDLIKKEIDSLFSEESNDKCVIKLSSVHRAKGLEWDNVYIICPHLMPHPKVRPNPDGSWSEDQQVEENLRYVACTRAKHKLNYVSTWPFGRGRPKVQGYEPLPPPIPEMPLPKKPEFVKVVDNGEPF